MLERPQSRQARRRECHAARMHRQRQRDGRVAVMIEVGVELIDLMVRTGWLASRDCQSAQRSPTASWRCSRTRRESPPQ